MKETGMIFTGESVRAIQEGRKTQTRRLYRPRVPAPYEIIDEFDEGLQWPYRMDEAGDYHRVDTYGVPGDRIWVREKFQFAHESDSAMYDDEPAWAMYAADSEMIRRDGVVKGHLFQGPWKSPIHMPRWASRITLEITDVRVQRLQEISEADAWAEGVSEFGRGSGSLEAIGVGILAANPRLTRRGFLAGLVATGLWWGAGQVAKDPMPKSFRGAYAALWDSINGKRAPWDSNPFVWAITFKQVTP